MLTTDAIQAQKEIRSVQWKVVAELPPADGRAKALGVAGPVTGVHNGVLIVAGGANFPNGMPWTGGQKKYYDDVYVLQNTGSDKFSWLKTKPLHLKRKLAYSGNVTLPEGIVCVGGETEAGPTNNVFLLQWNATQKDILIKDLPPLPLALTNTTVANIGKTIYVVGGEDGQRAVNNFFSLNLSDSLPQWKELPSLPIAASHAVAIAQSNGKNECIYVIGGRTKSVSGISDLHNTVFCYDSEKNNWKQVSNISDGKQTTNMSAATAVAFGETQILLMGGDKGTVFHRIETYNVNIAAAKTPEEKKRLESEKIALLNQHPGFSRDVLVYNTIKDCWTKIGEVPGFAPVTTTAVKWNGEIFIPSGEIKPGRRTPKIWMGKIIAGK